MPSRWLSLIAVIAVVGCGPGGGNQTLPPMSDSSTTSVSSATTAASTAASTTITPSTSATTTTSKPPTQPLVLSSEGLGVVSLGDPVDDVLAILSDRFGAPSHDWFYESPFDVPPGWEGEERGPDACHEGTHTGLVCFDYLRTVGWDDVGLYVLFTDLVVNPEAGSDNVEDHWIQVAPSFQGYGYAGGGTPILYTADGITVGSPAVDLLSLGDRIMFWWNECGEGLEFRILDTGESTEQFTWTDPMMWGSLDDGDFNHFDETSLPREGAVVRSLGVGQRSSC